MYVGGRHELCKENNLCNINLMHKKGQLTDFSEDLIIK
jgi:hypothetical protein